MLLQCGRRSAPLPLPSPLALPAQAEEAREPKETAMAPAMEREERTEGGMMGRKLQQVRPAVLPCPALP